MNWLRPLSFLLVVSPLLCFGQRKEYVELQRDVALLQDQVRTLQRTVDEKMATLTVLVQQALDNINKLNTTVAVLDAGVRDRLKEQASSLVAPVAGIGAKVDTMASEFQNVKTSIEDMNSRLGKVQQQLVDLNNTVKVIQAPPAPPPTSAGGPATSAGPPSGLSAEALYANALRDKDGGNYDVALQEFSDYLKFFGTTEMAPNAQFYVGEICYRRGDLTSALTAFDAVLEKYSQNNKTLDAMYMKGQTLVKLGERNKGADEFRELIRTSPNSELAARAKAEMKKLGLTVTPAGKRTTKKK
jgi:TolA-binding protein